MIKSTKFIVVISILFGFLLSTMTSMALQAKDEIYDAVYFGSVYCTICKSLEKEDLVFETLAEQGVNVKKYILEDDKSYTNLLRNYQYTYNVSENKNFVPILFVGETYYVGRSQIVQAVEDETVLNISQTSELLPIIDAPASGFSLAYFVLLGFVDGVNPCAIAMLLLFISLLGFTKKKSVLLKVSLTFISAIFISYFLFGTILYNYLYRFRFLSTIFAFIPWVIIGITTIFFILNFYDFIMTLLQKYEKVKNQLPRGIQKFNRRMMESFTKKMEEDSKMIYVITFFIGLVISFTEFLCTGQAYLAAILHLIHFTNYVGRGVILLLLYNLIFVLPLFIITFIAVKTQSVMSITVFMREKLHWIKLFNALVFLSIAIYYLLFMI